MLDHCCLTVLGVFPALRKGYLSMFMIGIYTDPEQPEKLLEGW